MSYSNLVYPIEEENFGIFNHRRRKRPNPWILIRDRILLIVLLKSLYLRLRTVGLGKLAILIIHLHPAFS